MTYSPSFYLPQSTGSSSALITNYTNNSSVTAIPQGQACYVNSSGLLVPIDVSNQSSWSAFVGYANTRIAASATGQIISNGRLQNFTTAYAVGTALYIGSDGNLTSTVPSIGVNGFVSGDMVIFAGVIVPNAINPSNTDISLFSQFISTL